MSVFNGLVSVFNGLVSVFIGLVSVFIGLVSVFIGLVSVFNGLVSVFNGLLKPLTAMLIPYWCGKINRPLGDASEGRAGCSVSRREGPLNGIGARDKVSFSPRAAAKGSY